MAGMDEYIEREALRDALYDADAITMNGVKILNQFPSADVAPVRHGRLGLMYNDEYYGPFADCEECGADNILPCNYCRVCGTKMDGDD